ncbi:unnamed protein product [Periconia digitata]|uniref:Uncharacterized protein n=1 Tax=Periconia digitata TaxID=1303443 RepID=A0A9W4XUQ8_9PLEO|nr:unnamed protein product [Periconia digitata]
MPCHAMPCLRRLVEHICSLTCPLCRRRLALHRDGPNCPNLLLVFRPFLQWQCLLFEMMLLSSSLPASTVCSLPTPAAPKCCYRQPFASAREPRRTIPHWVRSRHCGLLVMHMGDENRRREEKKKKKLMTSDDPTAPLVWRRRYM